ncbi:hypothetical protein DFQ30_008466, partial [Apophysomyces sp. BC1015]
EPETDRHLANDDVVRPSALRDRNVGFKPRSSVTTLHRSYLPVVPRGSWNNSEVSHAQGSSHNKLSFLPHFLNDREINPFAVIGLVANADQSGTAGNSIEAVLGRRLRTSMLAVHADFAHCEAKPCPHWLAPEPWFSLFDVEARMRQHDTQRCTSENLGHCQVMMDGELVTEQQFDTLGERGKLLAALRIMDAEIKTDKDLMAWSLAARLFPPEKIRTGEHRAVVGWMLRMFSLRVDLVALGEGAQPHQLDEFVQAARDAHREDHFDRLAQTLRALAAYEIVARMQEIWGGTSAVSSDVGVTAFHTADTLKRLAGEIVRAKARPGFINTDYSERFNTLLSETKETFTAALLAGANATPK